MQEITRNAFLVSAKGGVIDYVTSEGETLLSVAVPPGRVAAAEYLDICPDGAEPQVSKGLAVQWPRNLSSLTVSPRHLDSGANPDFEPSSAEAQQRRLAIMVNRLAEQTVDRIVNARREGLDLIETMPKATDPVDEVGDDDRQSPVS